MTQALTSSPLVLIDGHALAYRMYFALERTGMRTKTGHPTWAIYGFFNALFNLLKTNPPSAMALAFDMDKNTFRTALYPDYKATRVSMPDDLRAQMDGIQRGVEALGIPIYQQPDYEADDVIGTLSRQGLAQGRNVRILTGDQDAFQLVEMSETDPAIDTQVLVPSRTPKEGLKSYDRAAVYEKWVVYPEQVIDFKALKGDTSDNIPGVPGIGDKTAARLLADYQTLDGVYANINSISAAKLREKLLTYKEQAYLSQKLATIIRDVPGVNLDLEACRLHAPDRDALFGFLQECEFRSFIAQAETLMAPFFAQSAGGNGSPFPNTFSEADQDADEETEGDTIDFPFSLEDDTANEGLPSQNLISAARSENYELIQTEEALAKWVNKCRQAGVFAIDLETTSLDVLTTEIAGISLAIGPGLKSQQVSLPVPLKPKEVQKLTALTVQLPDGEFEIESVYIPVQTQGVTEKEPRENRLDLFPSSGTEETPEIPSDRLTKEQVLGALGPLLSDPHRMKLVHNLKFDCNVLQSQGITVAGRVFDTMIASYVHNPDRRHGLKLLGQDLFRVEMPDIQTLIGKGKKEISFDQVPLDLAGTYGARDARITWALAAHFVGTLSPPSGTLPPQGGGEQLSSLFYQVELPMAEVLAQIERTGVCLDRVYLKTLSKTLDEGVAALETEMTEMAGLPFNPNSPKQVGDLLFNRLGIAPQRKTAGKTGHSTDAKVLEQLVNEHPIVQKLLDYRQLFKLKSTYVDALPLQINLKSGRLHTSYQQTVTATGRLSSTQPNLQNIPIRSEIGRKIRHAFVPQPGWVLISADYSQIELRLLAHFSGDSLLTEAFKSGQDIHTATAARVFGISLEEVSKDQRARAKTVNFGVVYGQSAHGLAQQLHITRVEAQKFIDQYFATYSQVKGYIEGVKAQAHKTGSVSTLLGHTRNLSADLNSGNRSVREFAERAAFNTPLQGSAADLMKLAMIRLSNALEAHPKLRASVLLQVHDELVIEVHPEDLEPVKELILEAMQLGQPLQVPLVVDLHVGDSWMEA